MSNLKFWNPNSGEWEEIKVNTKLKKFEDNVILTQDSGTVSFNVTEYNPADDVLMVYKNSVHIQEGIDYKLGGGGLTIYHINNPNETWEKDTEFNFVLLKNVERILPTADGSLLQDGSVTDSKLAEGIRVSPALKNDKSGTSYASLKERLDTEYDKVNQDLAQTQLQKADKTEARLKVDKIELEDASEKFLGAMSGNATFNLLSIPQNESVTTDKLEKPLFSRIKNNTYKENVLDKVVTSGAYSSGTLVRDRSLLIPIGQTGQNAYMEYGFPILAGAVGNKIIMELLFETSSNAHTQKTFYSRGAVKRNGAKVSNATTTGVTEIISPTKMLIRYEYTIQGGETELYPYLMYMGTNAVTEEVYFKLIDIQYYYEEAVENSMFKPLITAKISQLENTLKNKATIITVKKDGTGDFTTVFGAVNSIKDSHETNQYTIDISDGEYDIIDELGGEAFIQSITSSSSEREGVVLPDYVHLNLGERTHLKGEIPDELATIEAVKRVSTINMWRNNNITGGKITAKNLRYAIHNESNNNFPDAKQHFENAHIEHYGNLEGFWESTSACGIGTSSGIKMTHKNCKFVSSIYPWSLHNNINSKKPILIEFDNCKFIKMGSQMNFGAFKLGSMGSGVKDQVIINNSSFSGFMQIVEEVAGRGNDFVVKGGGNTMTPYIHNNSVGKVIRPLFTNEVRELRNNTAALITKGTPVKVTSESVAPLGVNEQHLFFGLAWEDIEPKEHGVVKFAGYIALIDTQLTEEILPLGAKIIVNENGQLEINNTGDCVATATHYHHLLLK